MTGTPVTSAGPSAGMLITGTATCAAGKVVLGGGALVTVSNSGSDRRVALRTSYPSAANTWTAVAIVITDLQNGQSATVTAYALCSL